MKQKIEDYQKDRDVKQKLYQDECINLVRKPENKE